MRADRRVSVTEIAVWRECRWRHELHYEQRLQLIPDPERDNNYLVSGSAVHFGIEYGIHSGGIEAAITAARTYLESHAGETARLMPGVERAILGVPAELWTIPLPQTEGVVEVRYNQEADPFTVVGIPDHWYWKEEEGVFITDYKSTSKDEIDRLDRYEVWNLQLPFYGVLINDWWEGRGRGAAPPVYLRHAVLSTRGKHAIGAYKLLTLQRLRLARNVMLRAAYEIVESREQSFLDAAPSGGCAFCDYEHLCTAYLTGADVRGVCRERYGVREEH
ncbi:MAG TPA: PD-(D/E)XK nuclease family protein [Candidatus Tripitaka californicus]|uniref:PD-(D/E)XK nuclease family protein n=1 Tax=Candidatus Tripitaka californicus TaxID=3367616 RepID=UPI0040280498